MPGMVSQNGVFHPGGMVRADPGRYLRPKDGSMRLILVGRLLKGLVAEMRLVVGLFVVLGAQNAFAQASGPYAVVSKAPKNVVDHFLLCPDIAVTSDGALQMIGTCGNTADMFEAKKELLSGSHKRGNLAVESVIVDISNAYIQA